MSGPDEAATETTFVYDATVRPEDAAAVEVLRCGDIEVLGMMPWSSNGTFLVQVSVGADHLPAIYKPERYERPLWDFPGGLWRREVAASVMSDHLGADLVPTTVRRDDAPLGVGSMQAFVPARFDEHYFTMRNEDALLPALRRLCAFDVVINSADRKSGHCLLDGARVWAIDNGLSFHVEDKLRTVIWDFAGDPVPDDVLRSIDTVLGEPLPEELGGLLDDDEIDAIRRRAAALLGAGRFPHDRSGRRVPWPLI